MHVCQQVARLGSHVGSSLAQRMLLRGEPASAGEDEVAEPSPRKLRHTRTGSMLYISQFDQISSRSAAKAFLFLYLDALTLRSMVPRSMGCLITS